MAVGRPERHAPDVLPMALVPSPRDVLSRAIEANAPALIRSLRIYVRRFLQVPPSEVDDVTSEVLDEVVAEALAHAERFDPSRSAVPWLLGIGTNVIKRRRAADARRWMHEEPESAIVARRSGGDVDGAVFDQLVDGLTPQPGQELEANEQALALLALLPARDQELVRLAIIHRCSRHEVAQRLGIEESNARVRLVRALRRLRVSIEERAGDA